MGEKLNYKKEAICWLEELRDCDGLVSVPQFEELKEKINNCEKSDLIYIVEDLPNDLGIDTPNWMLDLENGCRCGSGESKEAEYDARGIFLTYCCSECKEEKLKGYRPEVLTESDYQCEEPIDE